MTEVPVNPDEPLSPKETKISDTELGNLVSGIGNHENKALTVALMKPGVIYSRSDIGKLFNGAQVPGRGWKIDRVAFDYCTYSLAPIGLVAREVLDQNLNTYGYIKTKKGEELGDSLAGLLLNFSEQHASISLADIFSNTSAPRAKPAEMMPGEETAEYKLRSPIIRLQVIRLLTSGLFLPSSAEEIAKKLELPGSMIGKHLAELSKRGLVVYESVRNDKDHVFFQVAPERKKEGVAPNPNAPSPLGKLRGFFNSHSSRSYSMAEIATILKQDTFFAREDLKKIVLIINDKIRDLIKEGYVEVDAEKSGRGSKVSLTPDQRIVLEDLINLFNSFQSNEPEVLKQGRQLAQEISSNPERVSDLTIKARESSPLSNARPQNEGANLLYGIISQNPGIPAYDLRQLFEQQTSTSVSQALIHRYIRILSKDNRITAKGDINRRWYGV